MSTTAPMHDNPRLSALDARRSVPSRQLGEPGPDPQQLDRMLQSALRVPDHGKLVPWRLLAIRGHARHRLGEFLASRARQRDPQVGDAVVDKDRQRFSHAPLVLAVIASPHDTARIPEQEQLLSAGCVCFALLQAAQALGFGAQWLTGWPAYDSVVLQRLGLAPHERIAGFIHVGTAACEPVERSRPTPADVLQDWQP